MTRRNTCPGCSHVIAAGAWWCGPCGSRMPSRLREAVTRAEAALGDARWARAIYDAITGGPKEGR